MSNKPHSNVQQAVPLFNVFDISKSIEFYQKLGFKMINEWLNEGKLKWCCLQIDNAQLMLQEDDKLDTKGIGRGIDIYFICKDALKIYETALANEVPTQEPFVGNHMWVVMIKDPDGYSLGFESDTDVPEETTFSEWKKH